MVKNQTRWARVSPFRTLSRLQASISKRLFWRQHFAAAQASLQALKRELPTIEMMMTLPLLFRGKGYYRTLQLRQNMFELLGLVNLLRDRNLQRLCEIGTLKGGTLFIWCQLADPNAQIISIDLPRGQFGGGYDRRSIPFFRSFCQPGQTLHCLRGSSHEDTIRTKLQQILNGAQLDFLFIDGDHSYEGVKQDFEFYSKFVKPGGIIAFHDIVKIEGRPMIEVHRFWDEFKAKHRYEEYIETSPERRKTGIGVIYKG